MASTQTLWDEYQRLSKVHYTADDFSSQSFVDRMNEAQKRIDSLTQEKTVQEEKQQQSEDAYNAFFGNMSHYSKLNDTAEDKYGVTTATNTYENAKQAITATEQMLNALPSTISRTSGVVMSQSRRELAYNTAANAWQKTMETRQAEADTYKTAWENARKQADAYAQALYGEQQNTLSSLMTQWQTNTSILQQKMDAINSQESLKWQISNDYREWQWQQAAIANKYARARAQDAFNAYSTQRQYAAIARQEEAYRRLGEATMAANQAREDLLKAIIKDYHRKVDPTTPLL